MRVSGVSAGRGPATGFGPGLVFLLLCAVVSAQQEVLLWPNGAPRAAGTAATDKPSLTLFPAAGNSNGAAVVIFPGGAYVGLSFDKEGTLVAQWLQGRGISGFVVKYRLGSNGYHHPVEMWDGQRAVRWVRAHAAEYGIDTARVGVLGFSAGGHLASTVSTHYDGGDPGAADTIDRRSCRPAFSILGYPVITMDKAYTHMQSRENVIGTNPSQALIDSLSNEKQVTDDTPPGFLFHATDDGLVPIKNSAAYRDSLKKHGIPNSLMVFNHGGHGFGMADGKAGAPNDPALNAWCDSSLKWLDKQGFLSKSVSLAPAAAPGYRVLRQPLLRIEGRTGPAPDALGRRPRAADRAPRRAADAERARR